MEQEKQKWADSGREAEVLEESKAGRYGTYAPLCAHLVEEEGRTETRLKKIIRKDNKS